MKPKKAIKELRKQLKGDSDNVILKIRLASLLRDTGSFGEAVQLYISVAQAYLSSNRLGQAIAVCKGILEFAPQDPSAHQMLGYLTQMRQESESDVDMDAGMAMDMGAPLDAPSPPSPAGPPSSEPPGAQPQRLEPAAAHQDNRRKRPTSFPTPLTDRGESSVSRLTGGGDRNTRPSQIHTLSPKRPEHDFTVGGAPPAPLQTPASREFRLADLASAKGMPREEIATQELPRLPSLPLSASPASGAPTPKRPAPEARAPEPAPPTPPPPTPPPSAPPPPSPPKIAEQPTRRLPLSPRAAEAAPKRAGSHSMPTLERSKPVKTPPAEVTPVAHELPSLPRLSDVDAEVEESYEPRLEDATIVDAGFDMAKFIAEQEAGPGPESGNAADTSDADLPEIPAKGPSAFEEETRVAGPDEALLQSLLSPAVPPDLAPEPDLPDLPDIPAGPGGVSIEELIPFQTLPEYALRDLARGATRHEYPMGHMLINEGEVGDSCFVLSSGELQVLKRDPMAEGSALLEVARLQDGALFGEFALLGDSRRHASVRTMSDSVVIEIPQGRVDALRERFPAVQPVLELFYRERMIQTLMSTARFFDVLSDEERSDVVGLFEPVRAAPGEAIIREGERSGGFYLVLLGRVQIDKIREDGSVATITTLGEGAYFGEVSLLRGDVAQASVTSETTVELARLSARSFYTLVAGNPLLWAQIWKEANRREVESLQIVAGATGNV